MRIIQAYWSLPSVQNIEDTNVNGRNRGGFSAERLHAMSWALSCLKLLQNYENVTLYTDNSDFDWYPSVQVPSKGNSLII